MWRWGPEHDDDWLNKIYTSLDMNFISIKSMKWQSFLFSSRGIPNTPQHSDSHPCTALEIGKVSLFMVFPPSAQVVFPTLEVTKVLLFIVFETVPPLPRWCSSPSKLPKYRYLSCPLHAREPFPGTRALSRPFGLYRALEIMISRRARKKSTRKLNIGTFGLIIIIDMLSRNIEP